MKELDIRLDDTLYWGEQEWECKEINHYSLDYPFYFFHKQSGKYNYFTKFGQNKAYQPPVLSFTPYSIENGGATFERPKKPLRPVDVTTLQKVRFRDSETDEWRYGFFVGKAKERRLYPYSCIRSNDILNSLNYKYCEPYEWTDGEV